MPSEIEKNADSQYQYEYTSGQVQGTGSVPEILSTEGAPALARDELVPSKKTVKSTKMPPVDAPELPIPTGKGVRTMAVKREIAETAKKNVWISSPSVMGAFLSKFWDLLNTLRDARFTDAQTDQKVQVLMVELGMENADYAKELRDLAANKEFVRAMGSFTNAFISAVQLGATIGARGTVEASKENKEFTDKVKAKQSEIDALDPTATNLAVSDNSSPAATKDIQAQTQLDDATKQKKAEKQKELSELQKEKREDYRDKLREEHEQIRMKADIYKGVVDGCTGVLSALFEKQAGGVEKEKAINETLTQLFSKTDDGLRKAKDDLVSQFDRVIQQLIQTSSENAKSHLVGRG